MPDPGKAKLSLELADVYGKRIGEPVDILLFNQGLNQRLVVSGADASKKIVIGGLLGPPNGLYRMECDPPSYMPVNRFVSLKGATTDLFVTLPVDAHKVSRVEFPKYARLLPEVRDLLQASPNVLNFAGLAGQALYEALDDIRRAGFLNIVAKCFRTRFAGGRPVSSYLQQLSELRGDRFFVHVPKELREETKNSVAAGLFDKVSGSKHHPPEGYTSADSFKTQDHYGNLQLTFFSNGVDWVADIDIDDANGFEHVFQVLRNRLTGRPTHPYDIQQILIATQEIDPGYKLVVGS